MGRRGGGGSIFSLQGDEAPTNPCHLNFLPQGPCPAGGGGQVVY